MLTADVEGSTRLSQTRLERASGRLLTLDQNISEANRGPWRVTRPVDSGGGSGLVVAFTVLATRSRHGTAAQRWRLCGRVSVFTPAMSGCAATASGSAINEVRVCATSHEDQTLLSAAALAIWSSTSFRQAMADRRRPYPLRGLHRQSRLSSCVIETYAMRFPPLDVGQ